MSSEDRRAEYPAARIGEDFDKVRAFRLGDSAVELRKWEPVNPKHLASLPEFLCARADMRQFGIAERTPGDPSLIN